MLRGRGGMQASWLVWRQLFKECVQGQRQKDHSATLHLLVLSVKAASIGEESWVGEDTGLREAEGNLEEGKQCSVLVPPLLLMSHKSGICFSNQTELKYKPNNRTIG